MGVRTPFMYLLKDPVVTVTALALAVAVTLAVWTAVAVYRGGVGEVPAQMRRLLPILGIALALVVVVIVIQYLVSAASGA